MELGGSPPEGRGSIEIDAQMVSGHLRDRMLGELERIPQLSARVLWKWKLCRGLEVAVKLFDGPFPAVAFIGDQALQHCQDRSLGIVRGRLEFNRSGEGRDPIEGCFLGEMSPDLGIRIQPRLQAAEQLQYEAVTVNNRSIALFCCAAPHRQRRLG